jgi:hypothetical protein
MTINEALPVFFLGFLGGACVEFYRIYRLSQSTVLKIDKKFWLVSLFHAIFGGIVSIPLSATLPWSAIFSGIAAPMMISALAGRSLDDTYKTPFPHELLSKEIERNDLLNDINEDYLFFVEKLNLTTEEEEAARKIWAKYIQAQNDAFETRFGRKLGRESGSGLGFLFFNLNNYGYYLYGLFDKNINKYA